MKNISLIISLILITIQANAQDFKVPENYKLEEEEDYSRFEKDVIEGVNWLLATPVTKDQAKRKEVNAFLMKWLMGSPSVSIELSQDVATFMGCNDCLIIFMGGWAKYALEHKNSSNKIKENLAGIESLIDFYRSNKNDLGKIKAIEKYIKLQERNKLVEYIESKV